MYDLHNNIFVENALNNTAISSNTTTTGSAISVAGYEAIEIVFKAGAITDGDYTPLITESDTSGGSYTAVSDDDLIGTEAAAAFLDDDDDHKVSRIGYRGIKPYIKVALVSTNVTTGGTLGAIVIKGKPLVAKSPANAQ